MVAARPSDLIQCLPTRSSVMFDHISPTLPLTGFALFADGRLLLQGGNLPRGCFSRPDQLGADAYRQFIWLLERALGANRNYLAQTDPDSIQSLLRVIILTLADRPRDRFTGAVLALGITPNQPNVIYAQPFRRELCQSVAGLFPPSSIPSRAYVASVERLGAVSATGRPTVA